MPTSRDPGAHCNACPLENIQHTKNLNILQKIQIESAHYAEIFIKHARNEVDKKVYLSVDRHANQPRSWCTLQCLSTDKYTTHKNLNILQKIKIQSSVFFQIIYYADLFKKVQRQYYSEFFFFKPSNTVLFGNFLKPSAPVLCGFFLTRFI